MYNPADLTQDRIIKLANKMKDPEARKQAAFKLASQVGPSPDEAAELGQMMQPQGGQQQPQLPPEMQMQGGLQPQMPDMMQPGYTGSGNLGSVRRPESALPPGHPTPQPTEIQPGNLRPSTLDEEQDAHQQMQQQNLQKLEMAKLYDELGMVGADPNDYWGKAAIAQEYLDKQSALRQQAQQMQQQQQQAPGGAPSQPAQPPRQQMPNQNFDDYVGGKKSWSF